MLIHWIWLATRPNLNDRDKLAVLEHFQDPENAFFAQAEQYEAVEHLSAEGRAALADKDLKPAEDILAHCARAKIHMLTYRDAQYPSRLRNISDAPLVLYYKGNLPDLDGSPVIAVVGTRKASMYGLTTAKRMGFQIGRCGGIVVSGVASGVDSLAMQGALTAGQTVVGVLGCGVDVVYPPSNKALFTDTERYGCLLSEFPPGTPPYKWNFPKRNRIMSGLSDGVLVVEAPERSGALITARQATDQGRDVFVVPGNIDVPSCAGSNALLREGAILAQSGWDVVGEYQHLYPQRIRKDNTASRQRAYPDEAAEENPTAKVAQKTRIPEVSAPGPAENDKKAIDKTAPAAYSGVKMPLGLTDDEKALVTALGGGEMLVDDLIAQTGIPAGKLLATLTLLEVKGLVITLPGRRVKLKQ